MKTFAINGEWIDQPQHIGESQAMQFGSGLFETIRIQNGQPLLWAEHMNRMQRSAQALGMDGGLDMRRLEEWTMKLLNENKAERCVMKILWFSEARERNALFYFRPLAYGKEEREKGLNLGLSEIRRNRYSRVAGHKTLNYLENILERRHQKALGFDEAILLNTDGQVAEGTASNVFILQDDVLITPTLACGILPGIQRQAVLDACRSEGWQCEEKSVTLEMLVHARGIYLTNSLMGFMPVSNFMGNCYDKDDSILSRVNTAIRIQD